MSGREMSGLSREFATRQLLSVRFGSKADMCSAQADVRFAPNSDREVLHRPLIPAIHIGCSPIASTDPARLCVRSTTYTEIYRCISHGAEGSALVFWDVGKSPH